MGVTPAVLLDDSLYFNGFSPGVVPLFEGERSKERERKRNEMHTFVIVSRAHLSSDSELNKS